MFDLNKLFSIIIEFPCLLFAVLAIIVCIVFWFIERKEHKQYIECRNHCEHEQMQATQEATQKSIVHLANAVQALEKMVCVSHGLSDVTKVKPRRKKDV